MVRLCGEQVRRPARPGSLVAMDQTTKQDAITLLRDQHDDARALLRTVAESTGTARREAFEPLVRLLAVHETAEEMVVYPALAKAGDEGVRIAEARRTEEDEAKKTLADLESLDVESDEFAERFPAFRAAVEAHAAAEEREVFPLLTSITDADQRQVMARGLMLAEGIAPTHAHRMAPESAIGNMLVGPFVSMVDRARDAIRDATK
jgi:hemerythrin superfamily protein